MQKIRARLTVANVVACMALFVALGGVSYAAVKLPRNSVGARQLKNGAVTGAKLKAKAVTGAKLGTGAVGTAALANGAVTAAKLDAGSLGKVPSATHADSAATAGDAATLQGRPPSAFIQGGGQILGNTVQLNLGEEGVPVFTVPGFGPLTAYCDRGQKHPIGGFELANESGGYLSNTLQFPAGADEGYIPPGGTQGVGGVEEHGAWTWTFSTLTAPVRIVTLNLGYNDVGMPTACVLIAQAVVSG